MKDPEFVKEVEKQGLVVEPITGEGLGKMMAEIYKTPKDVVSSVTTILARRPK